jgi:hypothetical protein
MSRKTTEAEEDAALSPASVELLERSWMFGDG